MEHPALATSIFDAILTKVSEGTLVDCFKHRNKIGLDVAIEALRFARSRKRVSNREILKFARLLRQEQVMAPYIESIV